MLYSNVLRQKVKKFIPKKLFFWNYLIQKKFKLFLKVWKNKSGGDMFKTFNRYFPQKLLSSLSLTTYPYFNPYFPYFNPFPPFQPNLFFPNSNLFSPIFTHSNLSHSPISATYPTSTHSILILSQIVPVFLYNISSIQNSKNTS